MYNYQKTGRYFAQHASGLQTVVVDELRELKVKKIKPSYMGVYFETDLSGLYRVNYSSRVISRILAPIMTFDCHSTNYLHQTAMKIDWSDFMSVDTSFAISASVSHSAISHSQYAALCLKDAIVDYFRDKFGKRPDVDTVDPDVRINLKIQNNHAIISLDTSGDSLHRRGYRTATLEAPMQETLAAAIIRFSGWDGTSPLYDPMCGSGTLLCEAEMKYCRIPAGILRAKFGFANMPDFDKSLWEEVKQTADSQIRGLPDGLISGSDINGKAVEIARKNLKKLPVSGHVQVIKKDFQSLPGLEKRIIVCNPPYGIRSGNKEDMAEFYHSLGEFLKHKCTGAEAYIYFGERSLLKNMALRKSWKKELKNGGLDGILARFEMY